MEEEEKEEAKQWAALLKDKPVPAECAENCQLGSEPLSPQLVEMPTKVCRGRRCKTRREG